jgi:hypothetical protein
MKVKELIERLSALNQDAKIVVIEPYRDEDTEERTPNVGVNYDGDVEL